MNLHPILRWLLWPFSLFYGASVLLRAWLYRKGILQQKRLNGIVISIGNLTTGGTGKTPMVIQLAEAMADTGKSVGILIRGYGSKRGDGQITFLPTDPEHLRMDEEGEEGSRDCTKVWMPSDEAQLIYARTGNRVRLGIGADRWTWGKSLVGFGAEWIILDDGFQHLRLARDADILLIDSRDPFGSGHLLPGGRLREPKSAMRRADLIVITRSEHAPALESVIRRYTPAPIFHADTELKEIYLEGCGADDQRTAAWLGKRMFVFCGIGNPAAFVENVAHWGMEVAGHMAFRDHHRYTAADLAEIERRAATAGAGALICTEKDSYNLGDARPRSLPLYVCRIATRLTDPARFWQTLYEILELKRA